MTETISLELAKEIAEKYFALGMEAPESEYRFIRGNDGNGGPGEFTLQLLYLACAECYPAYTVAEIFDALPVGTEVIKLKGGYVVNSGKYYLEENEILCEALGLMLCRVLDEKIKQKGV